MTMILQSFLIALALVIICNDSIPHHNILYRSTVYLFINRFNKLTPHRVTAINTINAIRNLDTIPGRDTSSNSRTSAYFKRVNAIMKKIK